MFFVYICSNMVVIPPFCSSQAQVGQSPIRHQGECWRVRHRELYGRGNPHPHGGVVYRRQTFQRYDLFKVSRRAQCEYIHGVQNHQWGAYVLFLGRKFQMKMGFYQGINHRVHQSSYHRERGEFGLCQGQVHLVNYCKVEDYNSGNITGAYCDISDYIIPVIPDYI